MVKGKIKQKKTYSSDTEVGINYFKIIVVLIVIFAIFYLITYFVTKKDKSTEVEPTIQYKEVIAGNILNINQDDYFVLVEFEKDKYNSLYETYLTTYTSTEDSKPYYIVDMSKGFNKSYISSETKLDDESVSKFKFSETTLLKIQSGKVVEKYFTHETIMSALEKLI